jgi:hypothetical protein
MPLVAGRLIPEEVSPFISAGSGRPDSFTAALVMSDFIAVPLAIVVATPFETPPIYVQGFVEFQGFINGVGGGTLKVECGICHPRTQAVLGYRTVVNSTPLSAAMIATFGARGQSTTSLQGDIFTWMTVRLTAITSTATINELILWFGNR